MPKNETTPPRKNKPGQGRKAEGRVQGTIYMLPSAWEALDKLAGDDARGKVVEMLIASAKPRPIERGKEKKGKTTEG